MPMGGPATRSSTATRAPSGPIATHRSAAATNSTQDLRAGARPRAEDGPDRSTCGHRSTSSAATGAEGMRVPAEAAVASASALREGYCRSPQASGRAEASSAPSDSAPAQRRSADDTAVADEDEEDDAAGMAAVAGSAIS